MDYRKGEICYKRIMIKGIVQGVGFRPYVFLLAQKNNISGTVNNAGGTVEILSSGTKSNLMLFIDGIVNHDIPFAHIERIDIQDADCFFSDQFQIIDSRNNVLEECFISPDLMVCDKCLSELKDFTNRRYMHYFNTCVSCGPRFSVIEKLPYDREHTSMKDFVMCGACAAEYNSSKNRRFHAETISCHECGPHLIYDTRDMKYTKGDAFAQAVDTLKKGKIIAIKGIGGYHFVCSPFDRDTVISLRHLKGRDKKPFAVMFCDPEEVEKLCEMSTKEKEWLRSNPRPITLLNLKNNRSGNNLFAHEVLFDDLRCGCFLPYTPLHHLLLKQMGPLIMTSANKSGSPIIKDDREMLTLLKTENKLLSGVLYHEREIIRGIEDSVATIVNDNQVQLIRRSRGYVPVSFPIDNRNKRSLLAMGGDLKAAFCVVKNNHAYMSQYFGDLGDLSVNKIYAASIQDYKGLFHIEPEAVICDKHPNYFSSDHARHFGLPTVYVQHHHAHIASVMAEHKIEGKVIGVAFDGSGYGDDGNIWGGEFLICEGEHYKRAGHLNYTNILGGDSSATDAKKTAACFLYENKVDTIDVFDNRFHQMKPALDQNINTIRSSSMGRLFDAVSAILGICNENSYEGQCAVYLQRIAEKAHRRNITPYFMDFPIMIEQNQILIGHHTIIKRIYDHSFLYKNIDPESLALGFHIAVANMIETVCLMLRDRENVNKIALSGGVFQNVFLLRLCLSRLRDNHFEVFINNLTPPNDSGISLGQAYIGTTLH